MNIKRLPFLIFILPMASIILTIALFWSLSDYQLSKMLNDNLNFIEKSYINNVIEMQKKKLLSEFDMLSYNVTHIEYHLKPELKDRVDSAYDVMMSIYENNRDISKNKMINIIKSAIAPMRFDDGIGYFFIYDMNGINILLPPNRSAEGKNFINFKDAKGKYPIQEAIRLLRLKDDAYLSWYWYKPINFTYSMNSSSMRRKIGYIRYFKPLNWFIGTGVYVDDEIERFKEQFVKLYAKSMMEKDKYFIAIELLKNNEYRILADSNRLFVDTGVRTKGFLDIGSKRYFEIILNRIKRNKYDGSITYGYKDRDIQLKEIIFYKFYKSLNMIVISRLNFDDIEKIIAQSKKHYIERLKKHSNSIVAISIFVVFFVGLIFVIISKSISNIFVEYKRTVEEKERQLKDLASYDELTKIFNRRKFNEILEYEVKISKRYKMPLSLIMFDLDHFKDVNDRCGHPVGDKVLKIISRAVRMDIRQTDSLARWGGEEFIIILPRTPIQDAMHIAESLRSMIEKINFGKVGRITCSFGVTGFLETDNVESFVTRMDKALYLAKTNGRNRVESL